MVSRGLQKAEHTFSTEGLQTLKTTTNKYRQTLYTAFTEYMGATLRRQRVSRRELFFRYTPLGDTDNTINITVCMQFHQKDSWELGLGVKPCYFGREESVPAERVNNICMLYFQCSLLHFQSLSMELSMIKVCGTGTQTWSSIATVCFPALPTFNYLDQKLEDTIFS